MEGMLSFCTQVIIGVAVVGLVVGGVAAAPRGAGVVAALYVIELVMLSLLRILMYWCCLVEMHSWIESDRKKYMLY